MPSRWVPANEGHAIERVAFGIGFAESLSQKLLSKLQAEVQQVASRAGLDQALRMQPMPPIPLPGFPVQVPAPASSMAFRRVSNGRIEHEAIVGPESFIFAATTYSAWADFFGLVERCLRTAAESALAAFSIHDVRLEYWDRFDARSDVEVGPTALLNPVTGLAQPFLDAREESWHSHVGYFTPVVNNRRNLINLNLDVVAALPGFPPNFPPNVTRQARAYTLSSAQVLPGGPFFESWDDISSTAEEHHTVLKSILGDLINEELVSRINLSPEPFIAPV